MRYKSYVLFAVLFLLNAHVMSQILNVDRNEIYSDTAKFITGSVALKFHIDNKNASTEDKNSIISLENTNDLLFVGIMNNYLLFSKIRYFNSTGGTFISSGNAHARANFSKMRKRSYEMFTQIQYDRNRDLDYRFLFGGGLRWRIKNTDRFGFFVGTELMYEHEKWDNPEDPDDFIIKNLPKLGSYASFRYNANNILTIRTVLIYQTGYDPNPGLMRNRISYDVQLEIEITKTLHFTIKLNGQYEDNPIFPINKFIYTIDNGLVWSF